MCLQLIATAYKASLKLDLDVELRRTLRYELRRTGGKIQENQKI